MWRFALFALQRVACVPLLVPLPDRGVGHEVLLAQDPGLTVLIPFQFIVRSFLLQVYE